MQAYGYKIYFDGERFAIEDKKSLVEDTPSDSTVSWNTGLHTGKAAIHNLNRDHKSKPEELRKSNDFLVKTCKDCSNYFILPASEVNWFEVRNLKLPCRCTTCRKKRKKLR